MASYRQQMASVIQISSHDIEAQIAAQVLLASMAEPDQVRQLHEDLEQFYRTRLIVALASSQLAFGRL